MPFKTGGLNSGLKWTITPVAGSLKSWAEATGKAPNVLIRKAIRVNMWANGVRLIVSKVCYIYSLKANKRKDWKDQLL